jgi:hypothetical protein
LLNASKEKICQCLPPTVKVVLVLKLSCKFAVLFFLGSITMKAQTMEHLCSFHHGFR